MIAGFAFVLVFSVSYIRRPDPPLAAVSLAYEAIRKAESGPATTYFPEKIHEAEALLDSARTGTNAESARFYLLRDYSRPTTFAETARRLAAGADSVGIALHESLRVAAGAGLREAETSLEDLARSLRRMPRERQYRQRMTRFEVALAGARNLNTDQAYRESIRLSQGVVDDAGRLEDTVHQRYAGWTSSVGKWRKWAGDTIRWSRENHAPAIIVRKIDHTCDLYVGGQLIQRFDADLGSRWMGDKLHRGDNATPEGTYRITRKKGPSETKYYKALLINYPNDEDLKSFRAAQKSGRLPRGAGVGSLIEIHGNGGRGEDWTMGCVALANRDMDRLFAKVTVGTPVTIIGSDGNVE